MLRGHTFQSLLNEFALAYVDLKFLLTDFLFAAEEISTSTGKSSSYFVKVKMDKLSIFLVLKFLKSFWLRALVIWIALSALKLKNIILSSELTVVSGFYFHQQ